MTERVGVGNTELLLGALASIVLLVVLIVRFKQNPFVALVAVSVLLGLVVRMPMNQIVKSFEAGVGGILGHVALVMALGTILGKMMAESGGAERVARTLVSAFGERNVPWAMAAISFIVGMPVFFDVGFVLLVPIAFNLARRTKTSIVLVGIPMVASLSIVHGLLPPHPAALLAVATYKADIGKTIFYALIVGIPTAIATGPLLGKLLSRRVRPDENNALAAQLMDKDDGSRSLPPFATTLFTILFPVFLMLLGSWADLVSDSGGFTNGTLKLVGDPVVALLLAVLVSFYTFGVARGFRRDAILKFSIESLAPTATIVMVVGAGGGFGRVLKDSGVAQALVDVTLRWHVPILFLAWIVAAMIRVATGSATVAMATAAGIVAPIAAGIGGVRPELLVLSTGAGSLVLSHVNDGGFWLVKEYFNMTVPETFKTWTLCETLISIFVLGFTLGLDALL